MPPWMTPELWPVWWAATSPSCSTTTRSSPGRRATSSRATVRPRMPAPTTTTSWRVIRSARVERLAHDPAGDLAESLGQRPALLRGEHVDHQLADEGDV